MQLDKKNILIGLCGFLALQILVLIFLNVFSYQNVKLDKINKPLISGLSKDNITSFEIKDNLDSFIITKKDGKWMVSTENTFIPGNSIKINDYVDALSKINQGLVIDKGNDTSSDKVYGFEQKQMQKVIVKTNNKKDFTISVGSTGSKRGSSYIKFNDEKKIREISSSISSQTNNQPIDWAEKNIFDKLTENDIMSVDVVSNFDWYKGTYQISFKEQKDEKDKNKTGIFTITDAKENYDDVLIGEVIKNIVSLNASEYKLNGSVQGREKSGNIKVTLKSGKSYLLDFYKADKDDVGNFIIDVDYNEYLYLIHEDVAKRFFKDLKELVKK